MSFNTEIKFHENIEEQIRKYCKTSNILNTLFYGPPGSGKNYQVQYMLKTLFPDTTNTFVEIKNENFRYKVSRNCIYIDGHDWKNSKASLNSFIEEITETNHVSGNIKLLYIRYIDVLDTRVLKQLLEDTYKQCRFIFTCRSLDRIDPAMISRCITIRVPSPRLDVLKKWINLEEFDDNETIDIIEKSFWNANTIQHYIYLKENVYLESAKTILSKIELGIKTEKLMVIHGIAETFFKCNIYYSSILKELIRLFQNKYNLKEINDKYFYKLIKLI